MEKISIIIPAYIDTPEKELWLSEAVKSAQKQTYGNTEVVIVDDASPLPVKFQCTRLNENVGTAIARNTAADLATGELLLPLDADDILLPEACELLYNGYEKNHFVYGNVTIFGDVKSEQTTNFPRFECRNVLNLGGVFPVTCLHSKESHTKAGGWKSILKHGLEDVEYWISMVRQCILGINIHKPILKYRKHVYSRTEKLNTGGNDGKTKSIIRKIHEDLYGGGDMPCAGCGGKRRKPQSQPKTVVSTNLLDYPESMQMTVKYNGPRGGTFGIVGPTTGVSYRIQGSGFQFNIHKDDWGKFKGLDGGKSFEIVTVAKSVPQTVEEYDAGKPEIAEQTRPVLELEKLDFSKNIIGKLHDAGWTVEKIATECKVGDLRPIPDIGPKTELRIMERAKSLYFK